MSQTINAIIGKTIEDAYIDEQERHADKIVLRFTDGTRTTIETSEWISEITSTSLGQETE